MDPDSGAIDAGYCSCADSINALEDSWKNNCTIVQVPRTARVIHQPSSLKVRARRAHRRGLLYIVMYNLGLLPPTMTYALG